MVVLVICKNEEDPMKNKGARVATTFSHYNSMGIFPDAQGQLTPQSAVEPGRNSNSSEMLWLPLLPARMKKIQSKMKLLEWPQHFPIITQWELSVAMETRVLIRPGSNATFPPPQ